MASPFHGQRSARSGTLLQPDYPVETALLGLLRLAHSVVLQIKSKSLIVSVSRTADALDLRVPCAWCFKYYYPKKGGADLPLRVRHAMPDRREQFE
jgi:hypothetical protein